MFTIRPSPGTIDPSFATFERLVGNLIQRAPFDVPGLGRPMSLAHASGNDRLDDDLRLGRHVRRHPRAGEVARVRP
jgi:hypothetical protein